MSSAAPPRPRANPPRKRPIFLLAMIAFTAAWIAALLWLALRT